ncbi:MAG TPA: alpha/beta fold hydrolase [Candidatus Binatia bacterium]|jgi:pimeloyl-ACP methyl ester carboxylesterase
MRVQRSGSAQGSFALHCDVAGAGTETVVLTHGLGSSGATWSALVAALAPRYRVVTWDMRAHGRSDSPDAPCTVAALGEDLAAVVAAVSDGRPVHVLGHSAGGVVAMRFAIEHPEAVCSLLLVGTASECNARAVAYYEALAETGEREGGAAILRRMGTRDPSALEPDGPGYARVARAMASLHPEPLTPEVHRIVAPTLIIVGEKDFLGVGGSVIVSRRVANPRLEIVPERGHAIFLEDPEGFARLVGGFLDQWKWNGKTRFSPKDGGGGST